MSIWHLVVVVGAIALYFLPALIAGRRKHHNQWAIFFLNLFLGWSGLGWLAAFIWACTAVRHEMSTPQYVAAPEEPRWLTGERDCPFCAERIKAQARVCKHCNREIEPQAGVSHS